jgi:uncharacterized protein YndB with AHSA1/START domain
MRYALIVGGIVVAIIVLVIATGAILPVAHKAARQITLAQPRESVFALISDPAGFPSWRKGVSKVELLPDANGHRVYRETGKDGSIVYQVDSVVPGQLLVTRIADKSLPFGGKWTYTLSGEGNSSVLRITEDGEVYNPLFRFVSRFIMGHTATIDAYMRDVAAHFGEPQAPLGGAAAT